MTRFEVWAPAATGVELVLGPRRVPMLRGPHGHWSVDAAVPPHGTDYAFALDGGPALPDPRSPWQPDGVQAPSRTVDHAQFEWHDAGFRPAEPTRAVIYELHVGTFSGSGTFDGAIARLDHLAALGVTHVELMPVAEFDGGRGWGYDGVLLFAPHHGHGGPDGLKRLVDACHARGLGVLFDVVYNHLGPSGNHLGRFGPYFTSRYATPWGEAVNLDGRGSDEVRRFLIDNARSWLEDYHGDGLRLDAVHALCDGSALPFLEQLAAEVDQLQARLGRPLWLIAESDANDARLLRPRQLGGIGLQAIWSDDFHHAAHALLTGERSGYYADFGDVADLAAALQRGFVYDGRRSTFRGRSFGRPAAGCAPQQFVVCLQNHDQVGNRAAGERLTALLSPDRLRAAAALLLLAPFVPLLFQGEEWAASTPFCYFTGFADADLGARVRDGRRAEFAAFGWDPAAVPDPQDPATFARSRLDWDELQRPPHAAMLDWYRQLLALRARLPAATALGEANVRTGGARPWLQFDRGQFTVACNFDRVEHLLPVAGGRRLLLASHSGVRFDGALQLPADSAAVLGPAEAL